MFSETEIAAEAQAQDEPGRTSSKPVIIGVAAVVLAVAILVLLNPLAMLSPKDAVTTGTGQAPPAGSKPAPKPEDGASVRSEGGASVRPASTVAGLFGTAKGKALVLGGGVLLLVLLGLVLYKYAATVTVAVIDTNTTNAITDTNTTTVVHSDNDDKPATIWLDTLKIGVPVALAVLAVGAACVYAYRGSQWGQGRVLQKSYTTVKTKIGELQVEYIEGMSVGEINAWNNSTLVSGDKNIKYVFLKDHKENLAVTVTKENAENLQIEPHILTDDKVKKLAPFKHWVDAIRKAYEILSNSKSLSNYFNDPKYDNSRVYGRFIQELVYSRNLLHKDGEDLTNKLDDACDSTYKTHSLKIGQNWAPEDTEKLKAWSNNMITVYDRFKKELTAYNQGKIAVHAALKEFDNTDVLKCFTREKNVVHIEANDVKLSHKIKIDEYDVNIITDEHRNTDIFIVKDEDKWVLAHRQKLNEKHLEVILSRMIYYTLLRARDEAARRALPKITKQKTLDDAEYDEGSTIVIASLMNLHKELIVVNEDWTIPYTSIRSDPQELARLRVIKFSDVLHNTGKLHVVQLGKLYDGVRSIREMVGEFQVIAKT